MFFLFLQYSNVVYVNKLIFLFLLIQERTTIQLVIVTWNGELVIQFPMFDLSCP